MFKIYFKITYRIFLRYKGNTAINIVGLALGISIFLLIFQYVCFEKSYDDFHKNSDRIYRLRNDRIYSDRHDKSAGCPPALAPTLKKDFPEVLESARLRGMDAIFIDVEKKISDNLEKVYYTEPSFLKIFSFSFIKGSSETALEDPNTAIISKSISQKYFGSESPINRVITIGTEYGNQNCKVTGVFEDFHKNSHLKINMLISYKTLISLRRDAEFNWGWNAFNTYILLAPGADSKALEAKFPAMVEKYKNYEAGYKREYLLQSIKDIHLYSNLRFEPEVNGSAETVRFLSLIALFVLILAWVNYINLSTSRSLLRAKEVSIRKVLGSYRFQIIKQFITESILLNAIAFILAIFINVLVLPYFNKIAGQALTFNLLLNHWAILAAIFIGGALLSGVYPALVISSYNPLNIFKSKTGSFSNGIDLRKGMVIFQFSVSIALIASAIIVYEQLSYMQNIKLGANIDKVCTIKAPIGGANSFVVSTNFKDQLKKLPGIKVVSISSIIPGKGFSNASSGVRKYGSRPEDGSQGFFIDVDEEYFELFEIPMIKGRNFNRKSQYNGEIIINEEAVKEYGFKDPSDAVNNKLIFDGFDGQSIQIVGVVKNYHQESLKSIIKPVIFNPAKATDMNLAKYFSVKVDGRNIKYTVENIKKLWDNSFPNQPFEYNFLDDVFNSQYKAELQFGKVFDLFTLLAIIISCLGLFGLASFTNLQRTKEIGIRKINGAKNINIMVKLNIGFVKWVAIAFIIACPIAYYAMHRWLENFAYKTELNWWIFALAGLLALVVALLTVSWQSWRAATRNPVESLRYE